MASSSSSSSSYALSSHESLKKYDVFISFRGEDTRDNFVSHLHEALCRNNIETYIDYRLEKGEEVWPSLVEAIEDSMMFLIVFSENYASSTWCLNELTKILECSKKEGNPPVIPVFYKINPSHIRKQTQSYEIAFTKHEQSHHKQQVIQWRDALTQAANIAGWDSSTYRNDAAFIGEIVRGVLMKLDFMDQSVSLEGLIGIQERIAHLESLMCTESQDVRFFGIWGMGGIGKTTIAKALFNKVCFAFESSCFMADVREECEKYGIVHLKNKLISILLKDNKDSYKGMPDGGSSYARRRLGRKKVLIVLDDVNDSEQLQNLAGTHNWFGRGSIVIITTRDKQVLGKNVDEIYQVEALEYGEALELFKMNAFKNNCFDEEFEKLSRMVVDYTKRIPLALIVLGSFLYGKSKEEWESQLNKLKKMPYPKIHRILKLSYEGLDFEEQNIFLDVACFLKGRQVEPIKRYLDACGYSTIIGLKSLQDKALITISFGEVSMHDLIQEMGLEIVREESLRDPEKQTRLWDPNDIYKVLNYNKGSGAIKGISLDMSKIKELTLSPHVFAKMQNLKFLEFHTNYSKVHIKYPPQGFECFPNQLRYLRWDTYPLKSMPFTFSAEHLVELVMPRSGITNLWHGVQNVVNLRVVDLRDSKHLMELPNLSKAKSLEKVYLSKCASLLQVHPSILTLDNLNTLELDYCVALTSLTSDTHLKSLAYLNLNHCFNLKEFSVTSENMKVLKLEGTAITELPSPIGHQFKLEELYLNDCTSLKNIQINFFNDLHSLKELQLNDCCNIFQVLDHISMLSSLNNLSIEGIIVESLPTSIKHLQNLQYLRLNKCTRLRSLPQLPPSLISLDAIDCSSLKTVQFASENHVKPSNGGRIYSLTSFLNCVGLDQHSIKVILANVLLLLNKLMIERYDSIYPYNYYQAEVKFPGSKVPEWFKYKSTQASITVDLSSTPLYMEWGLLFCFICSPSPMGELDSIQCYGHFQTITDQSVVEDEVEDDHKSSIKSFYFRKDVENLTMDHVFLWYSDDLTHQLRHHIKKSKGVKNSKVLFKLKIVPLFSGGRRSDQKHCKVIKECGVCPTYTMQFQNFIHELEMESEASASKMEVGCSYQSKDEEEKAPSIQKFKGVIISNPPTTTWKKGTQGFKDLFNL